MQDNQIILPIILIATIITLLLAFFLVYILFRYNQKQAALRSNFDKELLVAQLEIQEQTFQHIAKELHDHIGHYLTIAKLQLTSLVESSSVACHPNIEQAVYWMGYTLEEIRNFSRSMDSEYIANNGLLSMMDSHVEKLKKTRDFAIDLVVTGESRYLEENMDIMLFRIIQEAINNIIKHANSNSILITFDYQESQIKCIIKDDGCGFNVEEKLAVKEKTSSRGLENMFRRAKMINAELHITSTNNGTELCIITPY